MFDFVPQWKKKCKASNFCVNQTSSLEQKKRRGYFTGVQLLSHWQRRAKNCIETVNIQVHSNVNKIPKQRKGVE